MDAPAPVTIVAMIIHIKGIPPKKPVPPAAMAITIGTSNVRTNSACTIVWIVWAWPSKSSSLRNQDINHPPIGGDSISHNLEDSWNLGYFSSLELHCSRQQNPRF